MADCDHAFPVQPPEGTFWAPGPCRNCGITWDLWQAGRQLAEAQAALEAAQAEAFTALIADRIREGEVPDGNG